MRTLKDVNTDPYLNVKCSGTRGSSPASPVHTTTGGRGVGVRQTSYFSECVSGSRPRRSCGPWARSDTQREGKGLSHSGRKPVSSLSLGIRRPCFVSEPHPVRPSRSTTTRDGSVGLVLYTTPTRPSPSPSHCRRSIYHRSTFVNLIDFYSVINDRRQRYSILVNRVDQLHLCNKKNKNKSLYEYLRLHNRNTTDSRT